VFSSVAPIAPVVPKSDRVLCILIIGERKKNQNIKKIQPNEQQEPKLTETNPIQKFPKKKKKEKQYLVYLFFSGYSGRAAGSGVPELGAARSEKAGGIGQQRRRPHLPHYLPCALPKLWGVDGSSEQFGWG
jgi:hypothetical protein